MRGSPPTTPPKGNKFLAFALLYAKLGFRVIPLVPGKKIPLIPNWQNEATTDEATIREWWRRWPNANIGIVTGEYRDGYFVVIDFDPRNGGNWWGEVGADILPETWVVHTPSGGRHFYYKTTERIRSAKFPRGVDLKGVGGYVVAPPSILLDQKGDAVGEWGFQLGNTPEDMGMAIRTPADLDKVRRVWDGVGEGGGKTGGKSGGGAPSGRSLWLMPPPIPKGMRHDYLVSLAAALRSAGLSEREIEVALWGAIELLETREDFDPVAEIGGILKHLQRWEGDTYTLGSLLRMLPEKTAAVVRRVLSDRVGEPVSEAVGAGSGGVASEADGGEGADSGGKAKERENTEKKMRKSKTASIEDIMAILLRYKWVKWQGSLWQVARPKLLKADLDRIHGILKQNGLDVGKETLKSYYADIITDLPKDPLEGIVVSPHLTHGKVGDLEGLWLVHRGELYLATPNERLNYPRGKWPDGVYALDTGENGVLPDWDGEVEHLLILWEAATKRFKGNPKVALAMYLPMLFGLGHIGLILRGPARSGKSTLLKVLAFLHLGQKPKTPNGSVNMRDIIAVLHRRGIVFFDEVNTFSNELQETLKRMITGDGAIMRALYTDLDTVETELSGSAVFCTTNLEKLASDLRTRCFVWDLAEKGGGLYETQILDFCSKLYRLALGGAIKLYQMAAKLPPPPNNLLPQVRFRDWLSWGYRFAQVLEVVDEFVSYVAKSKRAAHRGDKYEFLLDAILHPDFDPSKEYTISELIALSSLPSKEEKRIQGAIARDGVRSDMIALALDAGYNLRIEKGRDTKERKDRYKFIFSPLEASTSDYLRELLLRAGIPPDGDADGAGKGALPAEPLSPNGHAPMPEVHTPPPAPQIAPEPVPVVAEGHPAGVGDGVPTAPHPPEKPVAIAVQSAQSPDLSLPTPEEIEREIERLREALTRLPKVGGILRQRSAPIEGVPYAAAPPEVPEYLRALACAHATEAAEACGSGRFWEAGHRWGVAAGFLTILTAFDPTREAIAAALLARAANRALLAAQDAGLGGAAGLFAKAVVRVFFGETAPDALLQVLLETPAPTEYDPCFEPSYREAVACLVAAHWVLTGGDPKRIAGWFWPGRWDCYDVVEILEFSLGHQKKWLAGAHLYLGELPF